MEWTIDDFDSMDDQQPDPDKYILDGQLEAALRIAVRLRLPLLLTGEPGTGKTQLAHKAARLFAETENSPFLPRLLEFHTKTSSVARDLLYTYDAVRHFHDAGRHALLADEDYITLNALGLAIVQSLPDAERGRFQGKYGPDDRSGLQFSSSKSSVVLIDEIDKASRDFPNDLLHEIDRFQFGIPEIRDSRVHFTRNRSQQIVVILTSNSEKNLPEAFLRRCAFFHIPTPGPERLQQILAAHEPGGKGVYFPSAEKFLIQQFFEIRDRVISKKPSTAEFLQWMRTLKDLLPRISEQQKFSALNAAERAHLRASLSVLAKNSDDIVVAEEVLGLNKLS